MLVINKKKVALFQYNEEFPPELPSFPTYLQATWMDNKVIEHYFFRQPERMELFLSFLKKSYIGVLLHTDTDWVSYAWMSRPGSDPPPHLPRTVLETGGYWIFFCRTNNGYQNQGNFKRALALLVRKAFEREEMPKVFADIQEDNDSSWKGTMAIGFKRIGSIYGLEATLFSKSVSLREKWRWGRRQVREHKYETDICQVHMESSLQHEVPDIQFAEGWIAYQEIKWGVKAARISITKKKGEIPSLHTVLYHDSKGRLFHPPMSFYVPIHFQSSPTQKKYRQHMQFLELAQPLVDLLQGSGFRHTIAFSPELLDIRPWQWAGFTTDIRYTFSVEFPYSMDKADKQVRNRVNKAVRHGYTFKRNPQFEHVAECLKATEKRQGFTHPLSLSDMKLALQLLGEESLRTYAVYSPTGEPVSAQLVLHKEGSRAYGWACGTKTEHASNGVFQLLEKETIDDLQKAGATGYDFAGANLQHVAMAKMGWGGSLVPYYTIEPYGVKSAAKWARNWWRFHTRSREVR
ncbi:hypothetical protein ERIC2_c20270 [Paenibacillus larvae subsp. larvae DSM 25430]|uniref:BioF2-like acetyltransferase domain-containing protein n=2 Tax=Paenibacillus larvae TaxID=1464 RepID=V9W7D5_9BACL|nr:hypothetical protein ERIC2_c20270 [Paenibacillus larvae subsp. larvae DSM 25430]